MENFPDIVLEAYHTNPLYALFFLIYILTSSVIVLSVLTGVFYYHFKALYEENLGRVVERFPGFAAGGGNWQPPRLGERVSGCSCSTAS